MQPRIEDPARADAATPVLAPDALRVCGTDAADLLHRICASEVRDLATVPARHLVFTDDRGALVDAPLGRIEDGAFLLIAGPGRGADLRAWIERWIIVDDVQVEAATGTWWRLVNADCAPGREVLTGSRAGAPVLCGTWDGPVVDAGTWQSLMFRLGRLHAGPPTASGPIPLELGWKDLIAFDKGCYIGQEVVARLDTYDKVKRQVGVATLDAPLPGGTVLSSNQRKCGTVLESVAVDDGCCAWVLVDRKLGAGAALVSETGTAGTLLQAPAVH